MNDFAITCHQFNFTEMQISFQIQESNVINQFLDYCYENHKRLLI